MNIQDMLKKEFIIEDLKSRTKKETLVELVDVVFRDDMDIDRSAVIEALQGKGKTWKHGNR